MGLLLNPYRFATGGGGSAVTFIQRSSVVDAGGSTSTLAAHGSAAVGDRQILAIETHASVSPTGPAGWTSLSSTTTAHSRLTLWTRTLASGDLATSVVVTSAPANRRMEMRTYRGGTTFTVKGSGAGLVSPSRAVVGLLIRFIASADTNTGGGTSGVVKTLTPDPALLNSTGAVSYSFYEGLVIGDDPAAAGATAPTRTATSTGTVYPQWVDVDLS